MEVKIRKILNNVQAGTFNHQKNIKLLENIYNSVHFEKFLEYFLRIIQGLLQEDYKNPCLRLLMEFLAKFVGYIARVQNPQNESELDDDPPAHPFLAAVIKEVVRYHELPLPECRYNACSFLSQTLQNIGDETQMDGQICDVIQTAMLENIKDCKPVVRLQAILALVRLQDPLNPECPVIRAYINCLKDSNPLVRREAVRRIAPNAFTIPKLKDRTTDRDANVRSAAFTQVAEIGIRYLKIVHRQFVLKSGFAETNQHVKKIFVEYMLPKWLTALNGEYIAFLTAIKLDADESDILNTEELSKKIMEVFFRTEPIDNLIKSLPLDENKVIPLNSLRSEITHYWNILIKYLRKSDEMDEFLDAIIPELTPFCNYLEKLISTQFAKTIDDWEYLDFQYMLYHLLDIAEHYDLSEEVGRRTLDNLLKKVLRNHRLQPRLLSKIVQIASKLTISVDSFTKEMCLIISDIREPLIEQGPSVREQAEKEEKIEDLRYKLVMLQGDLEDAVDEKDFQKAQVLKNEIEESRRQMEVLKTEPSQMRKVRLSKDDPETVCWCLDLLVAVLVHSNLKTLPPSLLTCREEFLKPLVKNEDPEIGWRVFKCLAVYCVFDKQMAEEHVKQMMVPIASYRVIPNFNKTVLIVSVSIITDFIRLYGAELFGTKDDQNTTSCTQTSTRRRLYNEEVDDVGTISSQMSVEVIVNVILDMLDDENDEIRDTAVVAIAKLILNGFTVNPMMMTRLILKWYNPVTQKTLQQKLGMIIKEYTEKIKESKEIVAKSVIPILTNIADAPRTSPLAEVDIENVFMFLAAITDSETTNGITHVHRNLAHTLISNIASRPAEVVTPHLAKMLKVLNIAPDNSPPTRELIAQAELLLEREALDKGPKLHIVKFMEKLKATDATANETAGQSLVNTEKNASVAKRLDSVIEEQEEEIIAIEHEECRAEDSNTDMPSKRRRRDVENPNDIALAERTETYDETLDRTIAPGQKTSELLQQESKSCGNDPDVISPSISPGSQEQTINNLRKRSRSNSNAQTAQSKKKKVATKAKRDDREEDREWNDKEVEGEDVEDNSESSAKAKDKSNDKENNFAGKKVSGKNGEDNSNNRKNKVNREVVSTPNASPSEIMNNRRSLRVVLTNNIGTSLTKQKDKEPESSDKEIKKIVKTSSSSSSDSSTRKQPKATSKQNPTSDKRSSGEKKGLELRKQATSDSGSTSSGSSSSDNSRKKRGRPRKENKASEQSKAQSSASGSSRSMSSTPLTEKEKSEQRKNEKSGRRKVGRPKGSKSSLNESSSNSSLNTSSLSKSLSSQSFCEADVTVESRLRPREDGSAGKTKEGGAGRQSTRTKRIPERQSEKNSKAAPKGLFRNNTRTASRSSVSDVDEVTAEKMKSNNRKRDKGLNNNGVSGREVVVRANGVPKVAQKTIKTQVKRKKARGPVSKDVREESIQNLSQDLFDIFDNSDQSLHTIIEPSDCRMSLLPDDSPEKSLRTSIRMSRRLQVVVSETSSDSESTHSPIRRSTRKKKVYNGSQ